MSAIIRTPALLKSTDVDPVSVVIYVSVACFSDTPNLLLFPPVPLVLRLILSTYSNRRLLHLSRSSIHLSPNVFRVSNTSMANTNSIIIQFPARGHCRYSLLLLFWVHVHPVSPAS